MPWLFLCWLLLRVEGSFALRAPFLSICTTAGPAATVGMMSTAARSNST